MTIAYPDVSNFQGSMSLEANTVAVCAKATEGTGYTDAQYAHFKAEAARVGAVFFAYHFLHAGDGAPQARHCFSVTGPGINVMIDHEPTGGVVPTLQDALDFATEYRALGGLCTLTYLPHWAWQQLGSPSLAPLARAGLSLVSSNYTAYSDTGAGWDAYGDLAPVIWQWTDALDYSGQSVDFNAYRGTVEQLRALLSYTAPTTLEPEMILLTGMNGTDVYGLSGGLYWHIADGPSVTAYRAAGVPLATITPGEHANILAAVAASRTALAGTLPLTLSGTGSLTVG